MSSLTLPHPPPSKEIREISWTPPLHREDFGGGRYDWWSPDTLSQVTRNVLIVSRLISITNWNFSHIIIWTFASNQRLVYYITPPLQQLIITLEISKTIQWILPPAGWSSIRVSIRRIICLEAPTDWRWHKVQSQTCQVGYCYSSITLRYLLYIAPN